MHFRQAIKLPRPGPQLTHLALKWTAVAVGPSSRFSLQRKQKPKQPATAKTFCDKQRATVNGTFPLPLMFYLLNAPGDDFLKMAHAWQTRSGAAKRAEPSEAPKLSQIFVEQTQANRPTNCRTEEVEDWRTGGARTQCPRANCKCEIYGPPKARVDVEVLT